MNLNPKVQKIIEWRESFATLPDNHFFELIRMYLGEIKTPYNKQKLIEELGSFIRKEENKKNLIALLNEKDLEIITAVSLVSEATQEILAHFFEDDYSYVTLYENILNLEERLILYRHISSDGRKTVISVNPLLEETLAPYVTVSRLLPPTVFSEKNDSVAFMMNPLFLSSFLSYVYNNPDMYKSDLSLKKRSFVELMSMFDSSRNRLQTENCINLLSTALWNLNLLKESEDEKVLVNKKRTEAFAQLPDYMQYIYLCVSACGHFSRSTLKTYAQLLLDLLSVIPKNGYTKKSIQRLAFFIRTKNGLSDFSGRSIFQKIQGTGSDNYSESGITECLIDSCVAFGILYEAGKNTEGNSVYAVSPLFSTEQITWNEGLKVLSIDAGFSITVMPGLSLAQLLPLIEFMDCVHYDTATVFEISRNSVMRSFDAGFSPEKIFSAIEQYCAYPLSQNLKFSVEEWYSSYSSASLYRGYVLKISEDKCQLAEKNPVLAPFIKIKLAPGVFLLDLQSDEEAKNLMHRSGLDFIGNIKTAEVESEVLALGVLEPQEFSSLKNITDLIEQEPHEINSEQNKEELISSLKQELEKINASSEQKEGLAVRIDRRIIISSEQLRPASVRLEKLEAGGMDYSGKIHVIESALAGMAMISVELSENDSPIAGNPVAILNKKTNAVLRMLTEPEKNMLEIPVSSIQYIKRLRGSILK